MQRLEERIKQHVPKSLFTSAECREDEESSTLKNKEKKGKEKNSNIFIHYRFLYHGDQKICWWTSCRWRAVNFEIHLCSFGMNADCIWRSISILHVQIEAGLNSDPGNDSFWFEIRDVKHVDRSTHYSHFSIVRTLSSTKFSIVRTKNGGPDWKPIQMQSFRFFVFFVFFWSSVRIPFFFAS